MSDKIGLSKSRYCRGVQCSKMLWMDKNKPELAEDTASEQVLANGNKVGDLAREYFGEYSLVECSADKAAMCKQTAELMNSGVENIAEASFVYDGLYCAVDILRKNGDAWDIVEVKSSTHVSDIYVEDMAFQYYVLKNAGVNVKDVYNIHINNQYVFHEKLDIKGLFNVEDYTEMCTGKYDEVEANIASIREVAARQEEPVKDIGTYCSSPYTCAYWKYCWRHIPENSIFDIRRMGVNQKFKYYNQGIITFEDIIKNQPKMSAKFYKQVYTAYNHEPPTINKEKIKEFLGSLSYPIYHLDFETFQMAVPEYEGCRPYQQIPFQYSLHIEHEDGTLEHKEFLAKEGVDPRRALAEQLVKDIPLDAFSMAYNMKFEKMVISELASIFPDLSDKLMNIHSNMHDLMVPFQYQYYYSEALKGSYSIKYVLPALCPDDPALDYHNLDQVHNGLEASSAFANMVNLEPEEIKELRVNLLKYCGLDTFAMVKVLGKLREMCDYGRNQ